MNNNNNIQERKKAILYAYIYIKNYNLLLSNYNNLSSHFESIINKHNQALLTQLQKLKSKIKSEEQENINCQETAGGSTKICTSTSDGESDYYTKTESQVKCVTRERSSTKEEEQVLNMLEEAEEIDQLLKKDWGTSCLHSDDLIIYPNISNNNTDSYHQWWDFWC